MSTIRGLWKQKHKNRGEWMLRWTIECVCFVFYWMKTISLLLKKKIKAQGQKNWFLKEESKPTFSWFLNLAVSDFGKIETRLKREAASHIDLHVKWQLADQKNNRCFSLLLKWEENTAWTLTMNAVEILHYISKIEPHQKW